MSESNFDAFTVASFESGDIDADAFDHQAHIYVAWMYLRRWPTTEAIERFAVALRRLTKRLGVPGKYHETITWFYMLAISERMCDDQSWPDFRVANRDLFDHGANGLLRRYYRADTLATARARTGFVLPDRLAA